MEDAKRMELWDQVVWPVMESCLKGLEPSGDGLEPPEFHRWLDYDLIEDDPTEIKGAWDKYLKAID